MHPSLEDDQERRFEDSTKRIEVGLLPIADASYYIEFIINFSQSELEAIDALMNDLARLQGKGHFFSHLELTFSSINVLL